MAAFSTQPNHRLSGLTGPMLGCATAHACLLRRVQRIKKEGRWRSRTRVGGCCGPTVSGQHSRFAFPVSPFPVLALEHGRQRRLGWGRRCLRGLRWRMYVHTTPSCPLVCGGGHSSQAPEHEPTRDQFLTLPRRHGLLVRHEVHGVQGWPRSRPRQVRRLQHRTRREPFNVTPIEVNSISFGPPHVRPMGVHRTCVGPTQSRKIPT